MVNYKNKDLNRVKAFLSDNHEDAKLTVILCSCSNFR